MNRIWVLFGSIRKEIWTCPKRKPESNSGPLAVDRLWAAVDNLLLHVKNLSHTFFSVECCQHAYRHAFVCSRQACQLLISFLIFFFSKFLVSNFDWIFFNHHLLLKIRQIYNNLHFDLLFKYLAKYIENLKFYLDSFLDCYRTVKPLFLPPITGAFGWFTAMPCAISDFARMHTFSFLQHFDPIHVPSQSSLKLHLVMSSLPSLLLKLYLELSFLTSACISLHISLFFRITLSSWLTVMTLCCAWIRHPSCISFICLPMSASFWKI